MDLGCIDMGCVEKQKKETSYSENEKSPKETSNSGSRQGKSNRAKDALRSSLNALTKLTSQITKPPHRKTSPVKWFPRNKVEPYLKRKIKMLQEEQGMQSTLDETLGDSHPHYSRVLREKIAIKQAADKAMEARKAAMIEASWCHILHAARIDFQEAESQLEKAETCAAEALEAARAVGLTTKDIPDGVVSTAHNVSSTVETAVDVDKQVAHAVKAALIKFASSASINKDEFKELLRKISEHPDMEENYHEEQLDFNSESECDAPPSEQTEETAVARDTNTKSRRESDKFGMPKIIAMMLDRLRCLKEDELISLATIVATCGLNAALARSENKKRYDFVSSGERLESSHPCLKTGSNRTSIGGGKNTRKSVLNAQERKKAEAELPSLDKFLVKKLTRLEREVLEAKNARKNESKVDGSGTLNEEKLGSVDNTCPKNKVKLENGTKDPDFAKEFEEVRRSIDELSEVSNKKSQKADAVAKQELEAEEVPGLNTCSENEVKLENGTKDPDFAKEFEEVRKSIDELSEVSNRKSQKVDTVAKEELEAEEVPGLDKFLVKRLTKLEREVEKARKQRNLESDDEKRATDSTDKENVDMNRVRIRQSKLEESNYESLDQILVKHVSRLEREKMEFCKGEEMGTKLKRKDCNRDMEKSEGSLDQVLVKHKSRLEKEKMAADDHRDDGSSIRYSISRRQAREKELQDAWGGLSLGHMRPHVSRLERDKAAWKKAEEEERKRANEVGV